MQTPQIREAWLIATKKRQLNLATELALVRLDILAWLVSVIRDLSHHHHPGMNGAQ